MGRTKKVNVLHSSHWHVTDSLDTGQTKDDAFNPKTSHPELDDSEQLTGDTIQPYLFLVGQLHWLVTLGRLIIHGQPTTYPVFKSTPRQLQRINGYVKRPLISIGSSLTTVSVKC